MKYFIDTEFIEGFKKPIKWLPTVGNFNKPYHSIQLISIGIVAEDGREYYAISNEFNANDASDWVKENVISKLPSKHFNGMNTSDVKLWKSNKQIAEDIVNFCGAVEIPVDANWSALIKENGGESVVQRGNPEFYAYYADYDWVLFCSLFGTMMDLPNGFPMYCNDLKQSLDEKGSYYKKYRQGNPDIESDDRFPKQTNEHNALDDARWNYKLYKFLKNVL